MYPFAGSASETPLERGTYLVRAIVACGNCHTPQGPDGPVAGQELAGQLVIDFPEFTAYAPNITSDPVSGIGNWTDEQIIAAIREGIRPDGTIIGPPMPIDLYRGMSDEDVRAIVAYLRTVAPVRNEVPKSVYRIPLPPSWGPPVGTVATPSREDKVAYGAYLAGPLGHCVECHSTFVNGVPDTKGHLGAGGNRFEGPWGISVSANITPHADGIGHYSDADLRTIFKTGARPDGTPIMPPMGTAYYRNMTDADIDALIAYLRSLPPLPSPAGD
ncbi:c-type cytochrome [Oceanibacterium hippocampi]|uniref:c-type cytochrome n=1 Tax=Oceanibacterium hippocampi TaxID=745714 RepID=UPI001FE254EA|nr:cytochrome c [Oceanibacterium hippocampi]